MGKICRDCFRSIGDGFPYGEVKCIIDGQYKSEHRQCDTGGFISKNKPFPPGKYCLTILPNGAWQLEKATDWAGEVSLRTL